MKRPLLIAAVVLTLGVVILLQWKERPDFLRRTVPSFRLSLEKSNATNEPGTFEGYILFAEKRETGYRLLLESPDRRSRVYVYTDESRAEIRALIGKRVCCSGEYFLFEKATNFGQFDLRAYYDAIGISAGMSAAKIVVISPGQDIVRRLVFDVREEIDSILAESGSVFYGKYRSLLLNDSSVISEDERELYDTLGFFSVLSSSGFWISSFGYLLYALIKKRFRRRVIPAVLSMIPMLFIGALLSFPFSFLRAFIVFAVRTFAPVLKRKFDRINAFSLALILLVIVNPRIVFLHSFLYMLALLLATGVLIPTLRSFLIKLKKTDHTVLPVLSFKACFLPVQVYTTYRPGIYGMLSGVLFTPVKVGEVALLILGILFRVLFGTENLLTEIAFSGADALVVFQDTLLQGIRMLPFSGLVNGRPEIYGIFWYLSILAVFLFILNIHIRARKTVSETEEKRPGRREKRLIYGFLILFILFGVVLLRSPGLNGNKLRYTVLDVGQGDGSILEADGQVILFDGGSTSKKEIGPMIRNTLNYFGKDRINAVFLSHEDADHLSGIHELLYAGSIPIEKIYLPDTRTASDDFREIIELANQRQVAVYRLGVSDEVRLGEIKIKVIWPEKGTDTGGNDASLVLSVSYRNTDLILTGDISEAVERKLQIDRSYELLKVAHHGSAYSSSDGFLNRTRPYFSVISYGNRNRYGHPDKNTVSRLLKAGTKLYQTGESGAICFLFSDSECKVTEMNP